MQTVPEDNNHKPESQGICRSCCQQEEVGDVRMCLKAVAEEDITLFPHYEYQV